MLLPVRIWLWCPGGLRVCRPPANALAHLGCLPGEAEFRKSLKTEKASDWLVAALMPLGEQDTSCVFGPFWTRVFTNIPQLAKGCCFLNDIQCLP